MNTSSLSEFIGYADLKDCHEISPGHFRDNDKPKCVGKFWYLTIFPMELFMQHLSHIFSYSNFKHGYLDNQSEYRKWNGLPIKNITQ